MNVKSKTELTPPFSDETFVVRHIDYGHGHPRLTVNPLGDSTTEYTFTITNEPLQQCQWRNAEETPPLDVLKTVEAAGYHVLDVTEQPRFGLFENVEFLHDSIGDIKSDVQDGDVLSRAALNWADESLESLKKLELLRSRLTDVEFQIILLKSQESSRNLTDGNLTIPLLDGSTTSARLKSVVTLMLAYAQHDGYLDAQVLDPESVEQLISQNSPNE